jgi:ribosomal protein S25
MVWIWLLHLSWKAHHHTFIAPNGGLKQYGVSPQTKRRVLRQLEAAGLIEIKRRHRKSPIVTLRYLPGRSS